MSSAAETYSSCTARTDALTSHSTHAVAALDWERDGWRLSYDGLPAVRVSRDALLAMDLDAPIVVVEQPHLRERNPYSVAQVYTSDELARLPFRSRIKLFPAKRTWAASEEAGFVVKVGDKLRADKDKDAEALALYAMNHPNQVESWKRFKLASEDPSRANWPARDALRNAVKHDMNITRAAWNALPTAERYALPSVSRFCALLDRQFDNIPDEIKEQYGIKRLRGKEDGAIRVERMSAAITAYFCLADLDGNARLYRGEPYGTRFILKAIGMSHSHRPNLARSQWTRHGMRHYKGTRAEYMRNLRGLLRIIRQDLVQ